MNFLAHNWLYVVALLLFVAMHVFEFGCGYSHKGEPARSLTERRAGFGLSRRQPWTWIKVIDAWRCVVLRLPHNL